ncbi:MAG: hypothetical protein ACRDH6_01985 [Actinomycetota bacterium]
MARTTGTASLGDLLRKGLLKEGERLVIRRRSAPSIGATLQADGRIRLGRDVYETPSAAARSALGIKATDGWLRWRVPRLEGKTLAEVRG